LISLSQSDITIGKQNSYKVLRITAKIAALEKEHNSRGNETPPCLMNNETPSLKAIIKNMTESFHCLVYVQQMFMQKAPGYNDPSPSFCFGVRGAQSLVFYVVFSGSLFVLFSFFFWSLYCWFFFDFRLLVTPFGIFKLFFYIICYL